MPTHQSKAEPTLLKLMPKLNAEDQAIICGVVRKYTLGYDNIHRGLLPFLSIRVAIEALERDSSHRCLRIKHKIGANRLAQWGGVKTINLYLDDTKVFKRFGVSPERGVAIPYAPRHKTEENVIASPIMTLRHLSKGYWQICLLRWYENHACEWLTDNCR